LKELNLAFNSIEKLENLECLQSLEVLNVFGNKIRKIENVDRLENLIIFSAGNNLIDTKDGVRKEFIFVIKLFSSGGH
jgi:Leucine-rich repeat (LRR) protein